MYRLIFGLLAGLLGAGVSLTAGPLGPAPYLSFADSPFYGESFQYFYLDDFEDGLVNTPGVSANAGIVLSPAVLTDSVDADNGTIDGTGQGGRTLSTNFAINELVFQFDVLALGVLPTHAGLVWTDVGWDSGVLGVGLVEFEAFDNIGRSLGVISEILGDGQITGGTAEDRFFGYYNSSGISRIHIRMPGSIDWEVDHLQYGRTPDPATFGLASFALLALVTIRKLRRRASPAVSH